MIPLFKVRMEGSAIEKASEVLMSGYIGQGKVVEEFERYLKYYFDHEFLVTTNSATSAEHLIFHMLKERFAGCDVLCTPLTCTATNWPVILNGYNIIWVDVSIENLNMDTQDLRRKITRNTKIIYITHWGGYPTDYESLYSVINDCERCFGFRPVIIEDCAHAMGAEFDGKKLGTCDLQTEQYATYSFQAIKHVTSVDGGVLIVGDTKTERNAKLIRWYGIDRETNKKDFRCEENIAQIGYKFHMNDVCAAIGLENMKTFDVEKYRKRARYYDENIKWGANTRKILYNDNSSYWLYTMFVDDLDLFMGKMKEKDIMVSRVHERNDMHTCVKPHKRILPNLDKIVKEMICIPCGWWVTEEQQKYIVKCINEGW